MSILEEYDSTEQEKEVQELNDLLEPKKNLIDPKLFEINQITSEKEFDMIHDKIDDICNLEPDKKEIQEIVTILHKKNDLLYTIYSNKKYQVAFKCFEKKYSLRKSYSIAGFTELDILFEEFEELYNEWLKEQLLQEQSKEVEKEDDLNKLIYSVNELHKLKLSNRQIAKILWIGKDKVNEIVNTYCK